MTDSREIEAKFEAPESDIERLAHIDVLDAFTVVGRRDSPQHDLYFDSADGALAEAGSSFRVRYRAAGARLTFKGPRDIGAGADAHVVSRVEIEIDVGSDVASRLMEGSLTSEDELLSPVHRALAITGGEPLRPTARIANQRRIIELCRDDGAELELAMDACEGTRLSDGRVVRFAEIELEARGIDRRELAAISAQLQALAPGIRPNVRTKLERVLG